MFEQAFKSIDDGLRKEAGCTTELDYAEQTSWLLFLKYLDGLEEDKATEAALHSKKYDYILDKPYRWETWAAPKGKDGKLDHNKALTGDDLSQLMTDSRRKAPTSSRDTTAAPPATRHHDTRPTGRPWLSVTSAPISSTPGRTHPRRVQNSSVLRRHEGLCPDQGNGVPSRLHVPLGDPLAAQHFSGRRGHGLRT